MKTINTALLLILSMLVSACGGSSGPSGVVNDPTSTIADTGTCQNAYYSRILGTYQGTANFMIRAEDGTETSACEWSITMDIRHEGSPVVCDLLADITATVEQTIVLAADDRNRFQCFPDESLRSVHEPHTFLDSNEYVNVPFPVSMRVVEDVGKSQRGSYFGDENVTAWHERLFDRGWVNSLVFNGDGSLDLEPVNNRYSGALERVE